MKLSRLVLALALLTTLVLTPGTSSGATYRVRATGSSPTTYRWDPSFRHIIKGNRVKWTNPTNASHRVVAYRGRWSKESMIAPGEVTYHRFRRTGSFKYRCTVPGHSTLTADGSCTGMCGTVHVTN